jgi:hypothetical protein
LRSSKLLKILRAFLKLLSENFRHIFIQRTGIILLVLLSFVNARVAEALHFHACAPEHQELLKAVEHQNSTSQESCSLCHAAHENILFLKTPNEFHFFKNTTSLPFFQQVFKTVSAGISTPSRAPPPLF